MDRIILEVIRNHYGDVADINTKDFYKEYVNLCIDENVTPKPRQTVTKLVCEYLDVEIKECKTYIFCNKGE